MTQDALDIVHAFTQNTYTLRRKVFTLFARKFHVYDGQNRLVLFSKMKAFKFKEDIRLYTGEDQRVELMSIRARKILDWSAAYDVVDSENNEKLGVLKRRGMKSIIKDEWVIMDAADRDVGMIREESTGLAVLRRFVDFMSLIFPQKFLVSVGGRPVAEFKQNFNPFVQKLRITFLPGSESALDRRLGLAAAILILGIEGRQN